MIAIDDLQEKFRKIKDSPRTAINTQAAVARALGVDAAQITRWIRRHSAVPTAHFDNFVATLGVPAHVLQGTVADVEEYLSGLTDLPARLQPPLDSWQKLELQLRNAGKASDETLGMRAHTGALMLGNEPVARVFPRDTLVQISVRRPAGCREGELKCIMLNRAGDTGYEYLMPTPSFRKNHIQECIYFPAKDLWDRIGEPVGQLHKLLVFFFGTGDEAFIQAVEKFSDDPKRHEATVIGALRQCYTDGRYVQVASLPYTVIAPNA